MSFQHTILLIQFNQNDTYTRTYVDFDSVPDAMEGIAQIFEQRLAPRADKSVIYVMTDLVEFVD